MTQGIIHAMSSEPGEPDDRRARRRRAVDEARHSTELAGSRTDAVTRELQERYVDGHVTLGDLGDRVRRLGQRDG